MTEFNCKDIFNSDCLKQPKREIADFVEQLGVPVPKRYSGLEEALSTFKPFVIRSEHPQDLKGASGICASLFVSWQAIAKCTNLYLFEKIDWEEYLNKPPFPGKPDMTGRILAHIRSMRQEELENHITNLSFREIEGYCNYAGLNEEAFKSEISYSYWEQLSGVNRTVMADTAIANRYHIFSASNTAPQGYPLTGNFNYFIIEKGEIVKGKILDIPEDYEESIHSLMETYEFVRDDKSHCPIMELQSARNTSYFLQYHKGVDFHNAEFKLERELEVGEIEALVVRGATAERGSRYGLRICYMPVLPLSNYAAVLDYVPNFLNTEAVASNRKLQIVVEYHKDSFFTKDKGHMPRSRLLKPSISAVFEDEKLKEIFQEIKYTREEPSPEVNIHFISDGRRAYMSRISS